MSTSDADDWITDSRLGEIVDLCRAYVNIASDEIWGGHLHIVLEDRNLEDEHIQWCRSQAEAEKDWLAVGVADVLLALSLENRLKVVNAL